MAYIKRKETVELTEQSIIDIVHRWQDQICTSYDIFVPNCYTSHDNEADLLALRRSRLCDEFEVKISRSDFMHDRKKVVNVRDHVFDPSNNVLEWQEWEKVCEGIPKSKLKGIPAPWQKLKHDALRDGDMITNYFWYVTPKDLVGLDELPDFAGLIHINEFGELNIVRKPKKLHAGKVDDATAYNIIRKLAYRFWDYRRGIRT